MAQQHRILVVDDEEDILELVRYNLAKEGYAVECVSSGEECLQAVQASRPDLVVLDLMLPGLSGLEVCRRLKAVRHTQAISIVMLTARGEEADIVAGLDFGADDYIVKPFAPRVLLARVQAVLRRGRTASTAVEEITVQDLVLDLRRHECRLGGGLLSLTATEFRLLQVLASNPGRVYTRRQLVVAVHGESYPVTDRSVDVQMVNLRKKLASHEELLETIRGVGYRFRDPDQPSE